MMSVEQDRDPDQHDAEQRAEEKLGALGGPGAAEGRSTVGDRLDTSDSRAARRERLQDQHDPERGGCLDREARADIGNGMGLKWGHDDHHQRAHDEDRSGNHQELGRLADPEEVDEGQNREAGERHRHEMVGQRREGAAEAGRAGGEADRHGEHVIDHQRACRQECEGAAEVGLGHRVSAPAVRVRGDHLRVGEDQQAEHRRDHQGQRHRKAQRAGASREQHKHHRLRPVGDARERVEAERGQPPRHVEVVAFLGVLSSSWRGNRPRFATR